MEAKTSFVNHDHHDGKEANQFYSNLSIRPITHQKVKSSGL
jgi:hypothetical protein